MIKSLLLAVQFLTLIPLHFKKVETRELHRALVFFPFVGLLLALCLIGINQLFLFLDFPQISINIILVVSLIMLTGGMHLDGLSDTADAFFSHQSKEEMLEIMHDSHVGVMGVLAIASVILGKIALLYAIGSGFKALSIFMSCIISRWALVLIMFSFPYARKEGRAKIFTEGANRQRFILVTLITMIAVVLAWQIKGVIVLSVAAGFVYLIGLGTKKKISGFTGDTLGATLELSEIVILLTVSILERISL